MKQLRLLLLPRFSSWARQFNQTLPPDLRYHHGYGVRRIGSESHRWAVENNFRWVCHS